MRLTEEQLKAVAAWLAGGASLDEIQKRLVADFGVHVTYFDLRMIVAELPQPEEKKEAGDEAARSRFPQESRQDGGSLDGRDALAAAEADAQERVPPSEDEPGGSRSCATETDESASSLTVTVDALMIPGTMASGDVVFSDGIKGKWYLDQMGRLGLGGDLPQGYRPSPADAALFQARLMEALRAKGLC